MDYAKETLSIFDEGSSRRYRDNDQRAMESGSRLHYAEILRTLSGEFGRKISVLDAGCGSGRYFHCLRNVRGLVGVDISPHMLEEASNPVNREALDIESIDLRCGDIRSLQIDECFDVIYSIGVIGEYSPVDSALLDKLFHLLNPDGKLFFTAVDVHSRLKMPENARTTLPRRLLRKSFSVLPPFAKRFLNRALSAHYLTERQLTGLLKDSPFTSFTITRYCHPSGWQGTHLDCLAHR